MAISLLSHAILDKEEVLLELDVAESEAAKVDTLNLLINRATVTIESWLDHRVVSRGSGSPVTEFHTMGRLPRAVSELYLLEWPIQSVTSVHEDNTRQYAAVALLTANIDYIVNTTVGKLTRIAGSDQSTQAWNGGFREYQIIYDAGYANAAAVPDDMREVAAALVAVKFREITKHQHGISGVVDDIGNIQRFGAASLTKEMQTALEPYKRREPSGARTGERDS